MCDGVLQLEYGNAPKLRTASAVMCLYGFRSCLNEGYVVGRLNDSLHTICEPSDFHFDW